MDDTTQVLIQKSLETLISVLVPILVGYLILAVKNWNNKVKGEVGEKDWLQIQAIISDVVKAAEQNGLRGAIENAAQAKKLWAVNEGQRILNERKLNKISVETLASLIEAKVREGVHNRPFDQAALVESVEILPGESAQV